MPINIVVATSLNNAIGKNNKLLWHLPADLKHFKELTNGHTVIMGRKTYDSIGKPLPNRRNIVVTRQNIKIDGCKTVNSIKAAIDWCQGEQEIDIIGGAEIYRQALPFANRIFLTIVQQNFEADTWFPELDSNLWQQISRYDYEPDAKNNLAYSFITLERH